MAVLSILTGPAPNFPYSESLKAVGSVDPLNFIRPAIRLSRLPPPLDVDADVVADVVWTNLEQVRFVSFEEDLESRHPFRWLVKTFN